MKEIRDGLKFADTGKIVARFNAQVKKFNLEKTTKNDKKEKKQETDPKPEKKSNNDQLDE